MKYDIITASSTADLVLKVQRLLNEGWELFGAPLSKKGCIQSLKPWSFGQVSLTS